MWAQNFFFSCLDTRPSAMDFRTLSLLLVSFKKRTKWVMTWYDGSHQPALFSCKKSIFGFGVKYLFMFSLPGLTSDIPFTHDFSREAIEVRYTFIKTSFSSIFFPPFQTELTETLWGNKMQVAVLNSTEHSPSESLLWHKMQPQLVGGGGGEE